MSAIPLVEPAVCIDTFVTGATPVMTMGDNVRVTLFASNRSLFDGSLENVVVVKVVGSRNDMLQIAAAIMRACNAQAGAPDDAETFAAFIEAPVGRH
jgi:hypothetical protein